MADTLNDSVDDYLENTLPKLAAAHTASPATRAALQLPNDSSNLNRLVFASSNTWSLPTSASSLPSSSIPTCSRSSSPFLLSSASPSIVSIEDEPIEEIPWRNRKEERKRFLETQLQPKSNKQKDYIEEKKIDKMDVVALENQPGAIHTHTHTQSLSTPATAAATAATASAPVTFHMSAAALQAARQTVSAHSSSTTSRKDNSKHKHKERVVVDLLHSPTTTTANRKPRASTLGAATSAPVAASSSSSSISRSTSSSSSSSSRPSHSHSNSSSQPIPVDADRQSLRLALELQEEELRRARRARRQGTDGDSRMARRLQEEMDTRLARQLSYTQSSSTAQRMTRRASHGDEMASASTSASAAAMSAREVERERRMQNLTRLYAQLPAEATITPFPVSMRQLSGPIVRHAYGVHSHALMRMNNGQLPAALLDVDRMSYEQLQELGERIGDVRPRVKSADIVHVSRLPVFKFKAGENKLNKRQSEENQCSICMCDFEEGDDVKVLPCLHRFHVAEIDKWLLSNEKCPVCRFPISGANTS